MPNTEIEYDKSEGKVIRLLELYFYIEEHPGVKADKLIDLFKVSPATFYRDIATLKRLGINVDLESTNRGGYIIEKGNIRFSRVKSQDVRPLLIAHELLEKLTFPQGDIFERLLKNMLSTIREGEVDRVKAQIQNFLYFRVPLNRRFSVESKEHVSDLTQLLEASINQWEVVFSYPSSNTLEERRTKPYGLWFGHNAWYLSAWCYKRKEIRTFAVDRIEKLSVDNKRSFNRPSSFNLEDWVETSWIAMPQEKEKLEEVQLEFDYNTGISIADCFWHRSQNFKIPKKEGEPVIGTFKLSKASIESEFLSWILSFGPKVKVTKPKWLVKAIKQKLQDWQNIY